jgi:hypothetical protein
MWAAAGGPAVDAAVGPAATVDAGDAGSVEEVDEALSAAVVALVAGSLSNGVVGAVDWAAGELATLEASATTRAVIPFAAATTATAHSTTVPAVAATAILVRTRM